MITKLRTPCLDKMIGQQLNSTCSCVPQNQAASFYLELANFIGRDIYAALKKQSGIKRLNLISYKG